MGGHSNAHRQKHSAELLNNRGKNKEYCCTVHYARVNLGDIIEYRAFNIK